MSLILLNFTIKHRDEGEGVYPWSNSLSLRLPGVISEMAENN